MDTLLTNEQAQIILHSLGRNFRLRSVTRPEGGLTGSVYFLETCSGDFVLRLFREESACWKLQKEALISQMLRAQDIPVAHVLKTDTTQTLVPFVYAVAERLPGLTLSYSYEGLSESARIKLYGELGDLLGRIHSLCFEEFGDIALRHGEMVAGAAHELDSEDSHVHSGPFLTWREMHRRIVQAHLHRLEQTEFRDIVYEMHDWFEAHDFLLNDSIQPRVLHMDLHGSNILVDRGKVTGILDWEESIIGHNEYDLMRTELAHFRNAEPSLEDAFFETYVRQVPLQAGYDDRKPFYELSRSLVGMKCLVAYGSQYASDVEAEKQSVRRRVGELMSLAS